MKLNLSKVVSFITSNIQVIILVIVVATLSSYIGMWTQKDNIEEWRDRYGAFKDSAAVIVSENQALKVRVTEIQEYVSDVNDSILKLNRELDYKTGQLIALRQDLDSIRINITPEMLEVTPPEVRDYIVALEETIDVQSDVIEQQNARETFRVQQVDSLLYANNLLTTQLDSITVFLGGLPETPSNPNKILGFIPKPTRIQSAIVGAIIGGYISFEVFGR